MTFLAQYQLTYDADFIYRGRACLINQAAIYINDERGDIKETADAVIRNHPAQVELTFQEFLGNSPGFVDEATLEDGTIDSSLIADGEILAAVQALWPTVAAIYFDPDGAPKP